MILEFATALVVTMADGGVSLDGGRAAPVDPPTDTTVERYRTPLEALTERPVGEASRAVRYDWRRSRVGFGVTGGSLLELNNFWSARLGGFVRKAFGNFMLELAVTWVGVWDSDASLKLALTPYRQFGRPPRLEIDANLSYALFEGVGTARLGIIPAAQLVLSATVGLRYLLHPQAFRGLDPGAALAAVFSPRLSDTEVANLDTVRNRGMQVDRARYGLLAGFTFDVYFRPGVVLSPRVMMAIPVFGAVNGPGLGVGWWWELSLGVGAAL